jgi:catechol 2,3-dioxygenase-like lactoylglutathione lyase family enzyme
MNISRIDHVGIVTNDLERALAFYSGMLDLPAAEVGEGELAGIEIPVGRSAIRLRKAAEGQPEGISYLAFESEDTAAPNWLDPATLDSGLLSFRGAARPTRGPITSNVSTTSSSPPAIAPAVLPTSGTGSESKSSGP